MIKQGSIVKMYNSQGEDFTVRVLNLFDHEGVSYAEVEPVGFNGFTREVPTDRLRKLLVFKGYTSTEESVSNVCNIK